MSLLINHFYRFGEFTLDTDQRVLLRQGKLTPVTPKVFGTLLVLVENSGRVVTKEELMKQLWPDTFVEEANLTYNIQQLRKALDDNARRPLYVETVPRRGYRFIADVEEVLSDTGAASGKITRRFESSGVQPEDSRNRLSAGTEAQETAPGIEPAIEPIISSRPAQAENRLGAMAIPVAVTRSLSKRASVIAAAILALLAGGGLIAWIIPKPDLNQNHRIETPAAVPPLRIEKLTETGQSSYAAISPDAKYVAYTRTIEKRYSIWLRQLATNTNAEIVSANDPIIGLAFAGSGESLYFVRGDPTALYRVSLLGGVPTKIVDRLEGKFAVSADDRQIAFIRPTFNRDGQREYSLMIASSDGTEERALLAGTHPDRLNVPLWSPDGKAVICAYGNSDGGNQNVRIVEVRVDDGTKKESSSDRFFHITKMAWLPDKSGLILSARKHNGDRNKLWRVSYPKMEMRQIDEAFSAYADLSIASSTDKAVASQTTRISDLWVGSSRNPLSLKKITQAIDNFCWTPDERLVYSSTASGNMDLWIMQPDGTEQKQLTVNAAANDSPVATFDNRYVAFISNRTGAAQVWRMDLDGSNQIQLTDGAGKASPALSPDGKWVLYNTTDDWHLWKVSIDGGEPVRLTDYIAYRPSVSPDGKMIACAGRNESKRELLILPFEGGQALKKIAFAGWHTRLQWAADGKALIYTVEGNGVPPLLKQSLGGGLPEKIMDFGEVELFDFGYSLNGQKLAVTRGDWQHDVVLISDLNRY